MKDLDLVGKNSLFQYFNVASTIRGKKCLLDKLTRTSFNEKLSNHYYSDLNNVELQLLEHLYNSIVPLFYYE